MTLAAIGSSPWGWRRGLERGKERRLWRHSSRKKGGLGQGGQEGQRGETQPSTLLPPATDWLSPWPEDWANLAAGTVTVQTAWTLLLWFRLLAAHSEGGSRRGEGPGWGASVEDKATQKNELIKLPYFHSLGTSSSNTLENILLKTFCYATFSYTELRVLFTYNSVYKLLWSHSLKC